MILNERLDDCGVRRCYYAIAYYYGTGSSAARKESSLLSFLLSLIRAGYKYHTVMRSNNSYCTVCVNMKFKLITIQQ
jgi:hypothetical protein